MMTPPAPVAKGIAIKANMTFGNILTDDLGKTLYFFANDFAGKNSCTGGCISAWPIFYIENMTIGAGLNQADFAEITNADGKKQITYKNWPLYYYVGDMKADEVTGDKANMVWYVAKPDYSLMIANNPAEPGGKYLVAPKGRVLYTFNVDGVGVSNCTGGCITTWPAFLNTNGIVPSILSAGDMSVITRTGETAQQSAYKGKPLYYFSLDTAPGDEMGQGVAGKWFKVNEDRF
jgi:predicted lipoprotein with Yx(FWY)xxD motif